MMNRREFLKVAGLGASAGLVGGCVARETTARHDALRHGHRCESLRARARLPCLHRGVSPDAQRALPVRSGAGHRVAIQGDLRCHVPGAGAREDAHVDPGRARPRALQPLREPSVHPCLSDRCHVEAGRWHRDDGRAPLHRLPVLHGGLPVRGAQLQLVRPARRSRAGRPVVPYAHHRGRGEAHLLRGAPAGGASACLRGSGAAARLRRAVFGDLEDQNSAIARPLRDRTVLRRRPALGADPHVYYLV